MLNFSKGFLPYSSSYLEEIGEGDSEKITNLPSASAPTTTIPIVTPKILQESHLNIIDTKIDQLYLVGLAENQVTHFSGYGFLKVVKGSVEINGFRVDAGQETNLRSPSWCATIQIQVVQSSKAKAIKTNVLEYDQILVKLIAAMDAFPSCFLLRGELLSSTDKPLPWISHVDCNSFYSNLSSPMTFSTSAFTKYSRLTLQSGLLANSTDMLHHNLSTMEYPVSWVDGSEKLIQSLSDLHNKSSSNANNTANTSSSSSFSSSSSSTSSTPSMIRTMICGTKGVGKSSCMRYVINRLLSTKIWKSAHHPICLIDCDVGQPECSVPGIISLHIIAQPLYSANYSELLLQSAADGKGSGNNGIHTVASYFLGDVTSRYEPDLFCESLRKLYTHYIEYCIEYNHSWNQKTQQTTVQTNQAKQTAAKSNIFAALALSSTSSAAAAGGIGIGADGANNLIRSSSSCDNANSISIPLIINTDGFVRYMGAEILCAIAEIVQPTSILHLSTEKDRWLPLFDMVRSQQTSGHGPGGQRPCEIITLTPGNTNNNNRGGGRDREREYYNTNIVTSYDLRTLRMIAYFLPTLAYDNNNNNSNKMISKEDFMSLGIKNAVFSDELGILTYQFVASDHHNCYLIPFHDILCHFNHQENIPPNQLFTCMNRSIVGLSYLNYNHDNNNDYNDNNGENTVIIPGLKKLSFHCNNDNNTPYTIHTISSLPSHLTSNCLGLGIIRAIDYQHGCVVLMTPIDLLQPDNNKNKRKLIFTLQTNLSIPTILLNGGQLPVYPYATGEMHGEGAIQMKSRTNLKRKYHNNKNNNNNN